MQPDQFESDPVVVENFGEEHQKTGPNCLVQLERVAGWHLKKIKFQMF